MGQKVIGGRTIRQSVVVAYVSVFYVLALWKWLEGGWLYQHAPFVFQTRMDGTTWLFMRSGLHQWLISHPGLYFWADLIFYSMPALWYVVDLRYPGRSWLAGWFMLVVNWVYVQAFTLYPTNSIEGHFAWLMMPLLFLMRDQKGFSLMLGGLRYVFLFFFFSAGFWKIYWGGVFIPAQMSNILIAQHAHLLTQNPQTLYTQWIQWLIHHPTIGWVLYLLAMLIELIFAVGFFTRRWDRWLLVLFLLFLFFDHLIMQIAYYEMIPMLIPLYFSSREQKKTDAQ
jgi:hypothetical protein